jgi:hypothetical protein
MPGGATAQRGNELFAQMLSLPLVTVPNLPASSTVTQTFTVPGTQIGDLISWNQLTTVAGISVENVFVSASGVLTFLWSNTTIAAVNGTPPQPFVIEVTRAENVVDGGLAALPNAVF